MINDWVVAIAFLMVILVLAVIKGLKALPYQPIKRERYEKYIHNSKWCKRRARTLILGNYKCAKCGTRNNFRFIILVISI